MNINIPLKELFPPTSVYKRIPFLGYESIIDSLGFKTLLEVSDNDYQGDTRVLLKDSDNHRYGLLIFGWGSCSGCDWLQGCDTYEQLEELRQSLYKDIVWRDSAESMAEYLETKDWEGSFLSKEESYEFRDKAIELLRGTGKKTSIFDSLV